MVKTNFSLSAWATPGMRRMVGGMVLAVAAGAAVTAWAQPGGYGGHGMGGPRMGFMHGDPARIDRGVDRMLSSVNATEAQRTQIKQIVRAAAADLRAQHDASRQLRAQAEQLFTAPTVDANAVEALRKQMLAQHDQSSQRLSQALVEISRVLTPEQRQQLAERMKKRRDHMRDQAQERARANSARPAPPAGQ
jgi:Spy/CpxP family protein refolding chaperone